MVSIRGTVLFPNTARGGRAILVHLFLCCALVSGAGARSAVQPDAATATVFLGPLRDVIVAITNAFASGRYHGMSILPADRHYDPVAQRWSETPATNEWHLYPVDVPLTEVKKGKKLIPYFAQFDIIARQIASNQCTVTIRTMSAWIPDGKELGLHGGWAGHSKHVPPIMEEETNLLSQIAMEMRAPGSASNAEPSHVPSWGTNLDWLRKWREFGESTPQAKDDLLRAAQAETNADLRAELLRILAVMTNNPPR